jgi:hypothetical protein
MAIQCSMVVHAVRAATHRAARRVVRHHVHHARRAVAHGVAALHTAKLPAVVCIVAGLAALGVGSFAPGGKTLPASAPTDAGGMIASPVSSGSNGADNLLGLIAAPSSRIGSGPANPFSFEWDETRELLQTPSTFAWNELGNFADTWSSAIWPSPTWNEIGGLQDIPSPPRPSESYVAVDMPGQPGAVPEPASISLLTASLFGVAFLTRRRGPSGAAEGA